MLYIVPTPIGNLEDITLRAIKVLKEVDLVLAEDTRTSGKLMKALEIGTQLRSFHSHNEHRALEGVIEMLKEGKDLALISDAGTPAISDPGFLLARACHENDIKVSCLPGPTAFVPALVASGLPCDKFHFEGFLPHKKGRQTRWKYLCELEYSFVLYESPHRLIKCLKEIAEYCGPDRMVSVSRELTKIYEETKTLTATEMLLEYESRPSVKGEIVIVVEGRKKRT